MTRCVNWRDERWIATWRHPSASWTPNQPQQPKQAASAASTVEKRSTGANGDFGLIRMGSYCACSSIRRTFQIRKAPNGFWPRIINPFLGCTRFALTRGRNKGEMHGCKRTPRYAGMSLEKPVGQKGICRHSEALGRRMLDYVGGTQSFGAANNYSPQQPQSRIERSLSLSWFYRNAPESALSKMLVFDHALKRRVQN